MSEKGDDGFVDIYRSLVKDRVRDNINLDETQEPRFRCIASSQGSIGLFIPWIVFVSFVDTLGIASDLCEGFC